MLTGTQSAEQSRPHRFGHASISVLDGKTKVWPREAAGQSWGDTTPQPAQSESGRVDSTWRKWARLESARSNSERISGAAWLSARGGHHVLLRGPLLRLYLPGLRQRGRRVEQGAQLHL
jgi:hypothetical protein